MYYGFYGLNGAPFELGSQPAALFLGSSHKEALATLLYGMESRKGVTVVVGEAGTGKTTLVGAAIRQADPRFTCIHIRNPRLTRYEFFDELTRELELSPEAAESKTQFLHDFQRVTEEKIGAGGHTVLVIDEAQTVSDDVVEELRLLTNMESDDGDRLLSVVLVGQPEFSDRLDLPELRHLKQRVALRCMLNTLSLQETAAFIATRIRAAGGSPATVFTREAVELIHQASRGVPRVICVLCDNALIGGFALGERPVARGRVAEASRDLRLNVTAPSVDGQSKLRAAGAAEAQAVPVSSPPPEEKGARSIFGRWNSKAVGSGMGQREGRG